MPNSGEDLTEKLERVNIDYLSRRIGRYNLVVAVSKRSKDLKERVDSVLIPSSGTLIKRSLREIAEGKVKVFPTPEQQPEKLPELGEGDRE